MNGQTAWAPSGAGKYRLASGQQNTAHSELSAVPTPSAEGASLGNPLSPENPLFWFGAIAAVTVGLIAFGTSVRVGDKKIELKVGDS